MKQKILILPPQDDFPLTVQYSRIREDEVEVGFFVNNKNNNIGDALIELGKGIKKLEATSDEWKIV